METLEERVKYLYDTFGQRKEMGLSEVNPRKPLFFLNRTFLGDHDLLVIFNTKRCQYNCDFCRLPIKSQLNDVSVTDILAQFEYVLNELKHSLSVFNRITFGNEGSVLDSSTFPTDSLITLARTVAEIRLVKRVVIETRVEFIETAIIERLKVELPKTIIDLLVGFETLNPVIRNQMLGKRETIEEFLAALDKIRDLKCALTAYVLFKPSPYMSDEDAFSEAEASIDFLTTECSGRNIPLTIRLNPMYAAAGSRWAHKAREFSGYQPPRLTDIIRLADKKAQDGAVIYIGLSAEGLDENWGSYLSREDYSPRLIRPIKMFNNGTKDALSTLL